MHLACAYARHAVPGPCSKPCPPVYFKHICRLHEYCMERCSSSGAQCGFGLPFSVFLCPKPALLTLFERSIIYTPTIAETGRRLTTVVTLCSGSNEVKFCIG